MSTVRVLSRPRRTLAQKAELADGTGPLYLEIAPSSDQQHSARVERIGDVWFTREQAIALARAFGVAIRFERGGE